MIQGRADDSRKKAAAFPANQAPVQIYCRRLPIQHRPEEVPKSTAAKFGHAVAGFLGIQLETDPTSSSVYEVSNAAIYLEQEPTVLEWIRDQVPSWSEVLQYFLSLFPFLRWISHYNVQWFLGDLIAGTYITCAQLTLDGANTLQRYHGWCCSRSTRYGVRRTCSLTARIRPLFVIYGCFDILVLCYIEGYHDWGELVSSRLCDYS